MDICPHCLREITEKDKRWAYAYQHAKKHKRIYGELRIGWFGFAMLNKAIKKYEDGERTKELLKELEDITAASRIERTENVANETGRNKILAVKNSPTMGLGYRQR